jgi:hypothetical protein
MSVKSYFVFRGDPDRAVLNIAYRVYMGRYLAIEA